MDGHLDYVEWTGNAVYTKFCFYSFCVRLCVCVCARVIICKQLDERTQAIPTATNLRNGFALLLRQTLERRSRIVGSLTHFHTLDRLCLAFA